MIQSSIKLSILWFSKCILEGFFFNVLAQETVKHQVKEHSSARQASSVLHLSTTSVLMFQADLISLSITIFLSWIICFPIKNIGKTHRFLVFLLLSLFCKVIASAVIKLSSWISSSA